MGLLLASTVLLLARSEAATGFNNVGISSDANPRAANYDGGGASNSYDALHGEGFIPGATITSYGIAFHWPDVAAGSADDWTAAGQSIAFMGSGPTLAFLGSATNGPSLSAAATRPFMR